MALAVAIPPPDAFDDSVSKLSFTNKHCTIINHKRIQSLLAASFRSETE